MGYFTLLKSDKNGEYYFNLKADNHQIILASEGYKAIAGAENGIASVQKNAPDLSNYDRRESKDGQHYFVLKAGNGEIIGVSEMFTTQAAMENGIDSVKQNGTSMTIKR